MGRSHFEHQPKHEFWRNLTTLQSKPRPLGAIRLRAPRLLNHTALARLQPALSGARRSLTRVGLLSGEVARPEFVWMRRAPYVIVRETPVQYPGQQSQHFETRIQSNIRLAISQVFNNFSTNARASGHAEPGRNAGTARGALVTLLQQSLWSSAVVLRQTRTISETVLRRRDLVEGPRLHPVSSFHAPSIAAPIMVLANAKTAAELRVAGQSSPSSLSPVEANSKGPTLNTAEASLVREDTGGMPSNALNIERVTDQVVRTLDERLVAWRERMGRS